MDYNYIKDNLLKAEISKVKDMITLALETDIVLLNKTNTAILEHPGKMIRVVLSLLVAKACGGLTEDSFRFAVAAELVHNASLLHDDVADNSASRRGRPTVMSLLGDKAAVLLGDYWLVKAVDIILSAENNRLEALNLFSKTLSALAEGEMLQLEKSQKCDTDIQAYFRIIYNKTASLFVSTARVAALSTLTSEQKEQAVASYAKHLGIAFQIKDDILDYTGDKSLGKPLGQDLQEAKITLPLLLAFTQVSDEQEQQIRKKVQNIGEHPEYQAEIVDFVLENNGISLAQERLYQELDKAKEDLAILEASEAKQALIALADFVIGRNA